MDTRELIESIIAGEEESADKFIATMEERVSDALEVRKVEIASGLIEAKMKDDDDEEDEDEEEDEDDEDEKSMKKEEFEQVEEATGVTDYNPKSQGGTRDRLLQKLAKSRSPEHATAARKAGATPSELKAAMMKKEEVEQDLEEAKFETRASWRTQTPEVISKNNKRIYDKMKGRDPEKAERFRLKYLVDRKKEAVAEEVEQVDEVIGYRGSPDGYSGSPASIKSQYYHDAFQERQKKKRDVQRERNKKMTAKLPEEVEQVDEAVKTTHENPLVTVHKREGNRWMMTGHMHLDTAKNIYRGGLTFIRAKHVHDAGVDKLVKTADGTHAVALSKHHAKEVANEELKPEFAKASKKHPELDRDQNHKDSLNLTAPEELRNKPIFSAVGVSRNQERRAALLRARKMKEEVEQVDEADKLAGLDYNKGHKLMYNPKGGKQKIVKTAASQQAHRAMGWKERHSVRAAMKEDLVNEADMTDRQKLMLMKDKSASQTISALAKYRKVGDINKLSPAHRTLVANYMERTGGTGGLSRSVQMMALKQK